MDPHFRALSDVPNWPELDMGGVSKGVGTSSTRESDWQFFAALRGRVGNIIRYDCGASAITPEWVLTAAHCVEGAERDARTGFWSRPGRGTIEVVLGQPRLSEVTPSNVFRVSDVQIADRYGRNGRLRTPVNDVALVRLERPWNGPLVRLSGSSTADVDRFFGQVFFAGHGNTDRESARLKSFDTAEGPAEAFSERLMAGLIPSRSPENCASDYGFDAFDPATMLCAGFDSGAIDACQGDSGGPLIARDLQGRVYQVGIVSSGFSCGAEYSPGLYARVSAFRDFITRVAGPSVFVDPVPEFSVTMTKSGLAALRARVGSDAPGKVQLALGRSRLAVGQRMTFDITSAVPGRLWVFDIDGATGKAACLFPCTAEEAKRSIVAAGERVQLPGDRSVPVEATIRGESEVVAFVLPPRVALISEKMPDLGLTKGNLETIRVEYPDILAAEFEYSAEPTKQVPDAGVASATYVVE